MDFHSLRTTYVNLVLESGAGIKEAMDLARHSTPDLTLNVYGRSRWERRAEIVNRIGEAVRPSQEIEADTIAEPERKAACLELPVMLEENWCERGELNPHGLATTGP